VIEIVSKLAPVFLQMRNAVKYNHFRQFIVITATTKELYTATQGI